MVLYLFGNADVHLSRVPEKSSLQILGVAHFFIWANQLGAQLVETKTLGRSLP